MSVPVVHYDSEHVSNPNPNGETPFEEFWDVRASILAASQRFGETGPESKVSPRYWLVEDQYNEELYQYMEVYEPAGWTAQWLLALVGTLREHRGWGIGIKVYEGYVLVFGDRVMVNGPTFAGCLDLGSVAIAAREATERFNERKYGPLKKQLQYIQKLLPSAMREVDANGIAHMATFDGYQLLGGHAIWVLQTKPDDEWSASAGGYCRSSAVTADGKMHPEYCKDFWPYNDVSPPYWLVTYLVQDKTKKTLKLLDNKKKPVFTFRIGPTISNDELD